MIRHTSCATIAALLIATAAGAQQRPSAIPARVREAADVIQQGNLKRDVDYLASDALRGRGTPSPGLDSAAAYVARRLEALELLPAGDSGTYHQHYTVRTAKLDTTATYVDVPGRRFTYGSELLVQNFGDSARRSGALVYVGHGIQARKKGIDPYANVDVRGKIVIAHGPIALPAGETFESLGSLGTDWLPPWQAAERLGAAALIVLPNANMMRGWDRFRASDFWLQSTELYPSVLSAYARSALPTAMIKPELLDQLMVGSNVNVSELLVHAANGVFDSSFALDPARLATLNVAVSKIEDRRQHNVVARIEGSDPRLRREAVVLMAHLDGAVGTRAVAGDSIYNAADDNASGSTGILAVAEAMMRAPRPKRSVVFIWDTGEEVGLWGSRYYAANPVVPHGDVVAHYNVDMIGRSKAPGTNNPRDEELVGENEIYVIGPRVISTEVDSLIHRTNRALHDLQLSHRYDVATHEFFYPRTDGSPLLERGVMVIDFSDGTHVDYHAPGDEPQKLDLEKMTKVARLIFATAWQLADSPTRPRLDKGIPASVPRYPAIQP